MIQLLEDPTLLQFILFSIVLPLYIFITFLLSLLFLFWAARYRHRLWYLFATLGPLAWIGTAILTKFGFVSLAPLLRQAQQTNTLTYSLLINLFGSPGKTLQEAATVATLIDQRWQTVQATLEPWFWLPLLLLCITLLTYIIRGTGRTTGVHHTICNNFKDLWIGTVLLTFLVSLYTIYGLSFHTISLGQTTALLISVIALLLWGATQYRTPWRYLVVSLLPAMWLLAPYLFNGLLFTPNMFPNIEKLNEHSYLWIIVPLILWLVIFFTYVWAGVETKRSLSYKQTIAPHRTVWSVLAIVVSIVLLFVIISAGEINQQLQMLTASHTTLEETIEALGSDTKFLLKIAPSSIVDPNYLDRIKRQLDKIHTHTTNIGAWSEETQETLKNRNADGIQTGYYLQTLTRISILNRSLITATEQSLQLTADKQNEYLEIQEGYTERYQTVQIELRQLYSDILALEGVTSEISTNSFATQISGSTELPILTTRSLALVRGRLFNLGARVAENADYNEQYANLFNRYLEIREQKELLDGQLRQRLSSQIEGTISRSLKEIDSLVASLTLSAPTQLISSRAAVLGIIFALFMLFLFIPWLLYLSFILSKRSTLIRDRRVTLEDLGLLDQFLKTSATTGDRRHLFARVVAKTFQQKFDHRIALYHALQALAQYVPTEKITTEALDKQHRHKGTLPLHTVWIWSEEWSERFPTFFQLLQKYDIQATGLTSTEQPTTTSLTTEEQKSIADVRNEAIDYLIKIQQFHSHEYVIPLMILTLLTGIGWYYTYFPTTPAGLVELIIYEPTIQAFTDYLTNHFTPVTMTFTGAWLYTIIMLMSRWSQDDLFPRSFFYAALRLAIAFLLGLVFAGLMGEQFDHWTIKVLAFGVGAAPFEYLRALWRLISQITKNTILDNIAFAPADWGSKAPLGKLEDLTVWDDARLYQEGVQNIHGLATTDLERLVLNTPFAAQQLVDWVDQALLRIHTGTLWYTGFVTIGLRTASDLLDFCQTHSEDNYLALVTAYNDGQIQANKLQDAPKATESLIQLKAEAIQVILDALKNDPNIVSVSRFWAVRRLRLLQPDDQTSQLLVTNSPIINSILLADRCHITTTSAGSVQPVPQA